MVSCLGFGSSFFLPIRKSDRASLVDTRDIIIVGAGRIGYDLYNYFIQNPDTGYKTVGFFDNNRENVIDKQLYLGGTDDCIDYVIKNKVDEIFCTLPVSASQTIEKLMLDADKNLIRFKFVPEYYDYAKKTYSYSKFRAYPDNFCENRAVGKCAEQVDKEVF